jgi:hypothetical protein
MRKSRALVLLAIFIIAGQWAGLADDSTDPRAIVQKAIQSMGGEEKLARFQAQTWKEKATYFGASPPERYEATYVARWPDKLRVDIQGDFTLAIDGLTGWQTTREKTRALSKEEWEEHKEGTYCLWVMSLLPLQNPAFRLKVLGEREVSNRAALAVRVSNMGHFDMTLYFDKGTGLLTRSETRFREAKTGKEIDQEMTFSSYKDEEGSGIKNPTHTSIKRNGKRVVEADLELKHLQILDDHIFAKP